MGSGVSAPVFSFIDCLFYISGRLKLKTPCKNKQNLVSNFFFLGELFRLFNGFDMKTLYFLKS